MAVYIGADGQPHQQDDELRHWKYTRREKLPNGKWKYYYELEDYINEAVAVGLLKTTSVKDKPERDLKKAINDASTSKALNFGKPVPEKRGRPNRSLETVLR